MPDFDGGSILEELQSLRVAEADVPPCYRLCDGSGLGPPIFEPYLMELPDEAFGVVPPPPPAQAAKKAASSTS